MIIFQVHKETIDKIPAAVHGRDNIHVEIYGMQGIPAGAYRGAADEEPDEKRSRIDIAPPPMPTPMPFPQHFPSFGMPPMPSGPPPPSMGYGMPPGMPPGMMPPPPHGMPGAYPPPHNPYPGAPPPGVYIPPPGMPGAYPPPRSAMGMPPMGPGGAGPPMGGPPMPPPQQRSRFDQPNEDRWGGPPGRGGPPRTPPYDNGHGKIFEKGISSMILASDSQDYGRQDDYQHHGDYDDRFRERDAGPPGSSRFDQQVKTENDVSLSSLIRAFLAKRDWRNRANPAQNCSKTPIFVVSSLKIGC